MRCCRSPYRGGRALLLFLAGLLLPLSLLRAQEDGPGRPRLYFPYPLAERSWLVSAGFTLISPPKELTEEARLRAPAFDLHALYGLPGDFYLDGRAVSQVIQNQFTLGGRWAHPLDRFSIGLGYDVAWWFGFLEVGGFDSKASGWQNFPSLTVGYAFDKVLVSFKTEAILTLFYRSYNGDIEVSSDVNAFSGVSFALVLEQPFYKNTHLTLGFKSSYTKFHWMTWSLFSTFDRYLFYPEIIVGWIL